MAFTDAQKAQIRRYLGYPDVYRQANPRLESALNLVGDRPDSKALIEADLAALMTLETKLTAAQAYGGLKRVDDIEFYPNAAQTKSLRDEGRRVVGRISITMGVAPAADVFGAGGYAGDSWMGPRSQYGGMFGAG